MAGLVADTHAILWYLSDSPRLSSRALARMQGTVAAGHQILVPTISLVEIVYLTEKGRLPDQALGRIYHHLDQPDSGLALAPLDGGVARTVSRISRDQVPDMPDRLIAATALYWELPLVTRDRAIQGSGIETIW
ncbi:MAG TPA: type II toxin-antitoxin system VapC family toxin [Thermoanaerobaculia bacterium]|nr:type II toxin-antitoxin system VapC family toxin [Thermoanaerobaculia bacterium]